MPVPGAAGALTASELCTLRLPARPALGKCLCSVSCSPTVCPSCTLLLKAHLAEVTAPPMAVQINFIVFLIHGMKWQKLSHTHCCAGSGWGFNHNISCLSQNQDKQITLAQCCAAGKVLAPGLLCTACYRHVPLIPGLLMLQKSFLHVTPGVCL